jgi:hypothetical protein
VRFGHDELEKQKEIIIMRQGFEEGTLQLSRLDIVQLFNRLEELTTRAEETEAKYLEEAGKAGRAAAMTAVAETNLQLVKEAVTYLAQNLEPYFVLFDFDCIVINDFSNNEVAEAAYEDGSLQNILFTLVTLVGNLKQKAKV